MTSETEIIRFQTLNRKIEIEVNPKAFRPNRVSRAFIEALPKNLESYVIDDIGSGTGILALEAAYRGARKVRAVEPAKENYTLLVRNISRHNMENIITPYQNVYFNPIKEQEKADIIIADVSGIPDIFARALGWYPEGVPTGGDEGYEITCELLKRAPKYLKETGKLFFPIANDLLDENKILDAARQNFRNVENALCSEKDLLNWKEKASKNNNLWKSPDYVWFQLRDKDMENLKKAYNGRLPKTMNIQEVKGRHFWRGQIISVEQPIIKS